MIAKAFASGHAVDFVLAVMLAEFAWISWRAKPGERASRVVTLTFALAPGALIAMALRGALVGLTWPVIALFLAASFPLHVLDMRRRQL